MLLKLLVEPLLAEQLFTKDCIQNYEDIYALCIFSAWVS